LLDLKNTSLSNHAGPNPELKLFLGDNVQIYLNKVNQKTTQLYVPVDSGCLKPEAKRLPVVVWTEELFSGKKEYAKASKEPGKKVSKSATPETLVNTES
jgi:hypothetical protein